MSNCGITREHTVWCSRCAAWHQESAYFRYEFVRLVKSQGWQCVAGEWLCPDCAKKASQDAPIAKPADNP